MPLHKVLCKTHVSSPNTCRRIHAVRTCRADAASIEQSDGCIPTQRAAIRDPLLQCKSRNQSFVSAIWRNGGTGLVRGRVSRLLQVIPSSFFAEMFGFQLHDCHSNVIIVQNTSQTMYEGPILKVQTRELQTILA